MRAVRPPSLFPGANWISAAYDYGLRKGPALAFVVHMAESIDNTQNYLTGAPARGVSVHFVVNRDGKLWQMLGLERASGSLNPADLRRGDDPDHFFGRTAGVAVMNGWYGDPNSAAITVEMDGRAATGLTVAQGTTLAKLIANVRAAYPTVRGVLGHRDFTATKACPGSLIPWEQIGGHGVFAPEADMALGWKITAFESGILTIKGAGHSAVRLRDAAYIAQPAGLARPYAAKIALDVQLPGGIAGADRRTGFLIGEDVAILLASDVTAVPNAPPEDAAKVRAAVDAGIAADRLKAHVTWRA